MTTLTQCPRVVVDYADTGVSESLIIGTRTPVYHEYLCENEKVCGTVLACSYGAQVESFKQKKGKKSRDILPFKSQSHDSPSIQCFY